MSDPTVLQMLQSQCQSRPSEIFQEPEQEYHAQSGCNTQGKNLSSHLLAEFARMPYKYQQIVSGQWHRPDSKAYQVGRAFHAMVLEGMGAYNSRYVWSGPINSSTGKPYGTTTKKWDEWAYLMKSNGLEIITPIDNMLATDMAASVARHQEASKLLNLATIREGVIRCKYANFNCQIRIDACGLPVGIVDLKSTAKLDKFEYDARNFGYVNQLAFYQAVYELAYPNACKDVHIIATEKDSLNITGVWKIPHALIQEAREQNEYQMSELAKCMQTGVWPTRYEEIRPLQF